MQLYNPMIQLSSIISDMNLLKYNQKCTGWKEKIERTQKELKMSIGTMGNIKAVSIYNYRDFIF